MNIVERDHEFATAMLLFEQSVQSRTSRIAWITGSCATGKTTLLNALAVLISETREIVSLAASGSRFELRLETGLICQLIRSIEPPGHTLERHMRMLEAVARCAWQDALPHNLSADLRIVFDELCELFLGTAKNTPVLITVDDIQFADKSSLHFLLYLARRSKSAPILIVISEPIESPLPDPWIRTELLRFPHCHQIRLGPLSRDGVRQLLAARLRPLLARELTPKFYALTGGNPLLVHALIKDSGEALTKGTAQPRQLFGHAVLASMHRYDPEVIHIAQALAILHEAADCEVASEMLGHAPESAARAIEILHAARLLTGQRFRHEAIRTAILSRITAEEHARLHQAAATALHSRCRPACQIADHIVATPGWMPAWAMPVLCEAAEDALEDGKVEAAVAYLRHAHQGCRGDEARRAAALARLCRAMWQFDPAAAARRTPELADALDAGYLDSSDRMTLVKQLLWEGMAARAAKVVEVRPAGHELTTGPDSAAFFLASLYPSLTGTSLAPGPPYASSARTWQTLRNGRLTEQTIGPILSSLTALVVADHVELAETWIDALLTQLAGRAACLTWKALLLGLQAVARVKRGDYSRAESSARTAIDLLGPKGWGVLIGLPLSCLIIATTRLDKTADAAELLHHRVPSAMMRTTIGLLYLHARGQYHLAVTELGAALRDFDSCETLAAEWGADILPLLPWRLDRARSLLHVGDITQARQLLAEELHGVPPGHSLTRGSILHLMALTKPPDEQPQALRQAVRLLAGAPPAQAHAYTDLSYALKQLGDSRGAAAAAQKARSLFATSGSKPCEPSLAHSHPVAPRFPPHGVRLSKAEQRVARLAAKGLTNEQISRQLHVTVSTVEQHLTRVYRKLNIRGRVDLQLERQLA